MKVIDIYEEVKAAKTIGSADISALMGTVSVPALDYIFI